MKMKHITLFLVLVLILTACAKQTPDTNQNQIPAEIFTEAIQTMTAQYTPMTSTPTVTPTLETATFTPEPTTLTTAGPLVPTATTKPCDNSVFANDVTIPDNTVISAGNTFTKTWAIKNTGTCSWSSTYKLKFTSGNKMSGHMQAVDTTIAPNATTTISITMTAPSTPGTYVGYWRMINDASLPFGQLVSVKIVVPN